MLNLGNMTLKKMFNESIFELLKENIDVLLDGYALRDVMFEGKLKTLELTNNMKFILKPQEDR